MPKYIKQLTRENTLLERSLRTLAYNTGVKEIGKAKITKSPILGIGRVTSLYYDPVDYKKQQKIITSEFRGERIEKMGRKMIKYLEEAYLWAKINRNRKIPKEELISFIDLFFKHHARSRGILVYGYWGEPAVTQKLKLSLSKSKKINPADLDHLISALSTPIPIGKPLNELQKFSDRERRKRNELIEKLKLSEKEKELADILSWFTFFYEYGERVSWYLYMQLLEQVKREVKNKNDYNNFEWYDPESLVNYFKGKRLSEKELAERKKTYVLLIKNNKVLVLTGKKALEFSKENFSENLNIKNNKEIRGVIASKGKARGIARIVITQEDQAKMKKGDILVSTMTTPYLMSAVKRAAAIVTDEGGLTAHAAIIARELNIPCIIGTKYATKVLKDGDLIEVDANKGIIKILGK